MVGVLERLAPTRRRFDKGGSTDDTQPTDQTAVSPDQGALAGTGAGAGPGIYDTVASPDTGALARGATQQDPQDAQRLTAMQRAMTILQAGHTTNLPLLAAAGALLSPTRTGSFGESLGNAFQAAVPVAEQERKLQEEALLRAEQAETNRIWRQGQLAVNQQKANAGDLRTDIYGRRVDSLSAKDAAIAARQQALAAVGPHATAGDLQKATIDATVRTLMGKVNPDTGQPWTQDEAQAQAWDTVKNFQVSRDRAGIALGNSMENLRHHEATEGQADERNTSNQQYRADTLDLRKQALAQAAKIADQRERAAAIRLAQTATNVDLQTASKNMSNEPGTKFLDQLKTVRGGRASAPTATAPAAPGPAAATGTTSGSGTLGTYSNPYQPKTPEEAAAYPPGTYFMSPSGMRVR